MHQGQGYLQGQPEEERESPTIPPVRSSKGLQVFHYTPLRTVGSGRSGALFKGRVEGSSYGGRGRGGNTCSGGHVSQLARYSGFWKLLNLACQTFCLTKLMSVHLLTPKKTTF